MAFLRLSFQQYRYWVFAVVSTLCFLVNPLVAAEALIDGAASSTTNAQQIAGYANVFVSDTVGYHFYVGGDNTCYYRKTSDAGSTWGSAVQFNNLTDCTNVAVWYDQWTPGDTGENIHIVSMHTGSNDLRYNQLDTSSDTLLLGATAVDATNGQTPTLSLGAALPTIAKGTDGTVYIAITDNSDGFVQECSVSCGLSGSWSETGANPLDTATGDMQLLVPLLGGDMMVIVRDRTTDDVLSKVWDNSLWDASWTSIDTNAGESSEYELALAAVTNPNTGRVHLAYIADHNNFSTADHDIRTAYYDSGSWTNTSDITTNDARGLTDLSIALDSNTGAVYVTYAARTTINNAATANVYWASSTAVMSSWGTEVGPLNVGADNMYRVSSNYLSNQRLFVSWFEAGTSDLRGDTIVDITPPLTVSTLGTHVAEVRGDTANFYVGGTYVMEEFGGGRDVTSITVTESGSVDGANDVDNIRLLYDVDTSAPYDCASESYGGGELQFGATDTTGFSGTNGVATFADTVSVTSTSTLCVYVLLDVLDSAADGQTIALSIANPSTDVLVSGGFSAQPSTSVAPTGNTTVVYPNLIQSGFHWRNNDGTEADATSATGGIENTELENLTRGTAKRLRISVSNEGSTSTAANPLRLEYGETNSNCSAVAVWTDVGAADDTWNMFNTANLTNGDDTTDIATSTGGVSNLNPTFKTPNGGQLDTSSQTSALSITPTEFVEYEFSLQASSTASQGTTYCFRLTEGGSEITYSQYPSVTIAADVNVASVGSQITSAEIGTTDVYAGGVFAITEAANARNVTSVTISETGSIDAATDLSNVELYYESDTVAPYNCAAETYSGTETQYGSTVAAFSAADGTASFSDTVGISTTSALCLYVVYDVDTTAQNGEVVALEIFNPSLDISVSGGAAVAPTTPVALTGSTVVTGAIVTQTHYHWRNDDGTETDATSATGGIEDVAIEDVSKNEVYRLRVGLSNEGGTSTPSVQYKLQFGTKQTSCNVVAAWTDVDALPNDAWDMFDSTFLTHGDNTTDIPVGDGGVSDEEAVFLTSNGGVRDTDASTPTTTLASNNYVDYEFSLTTTTNTPFETDFCFRLVENGQPLTAYDEYPEAAIRTNRDFKIQRGVETVSGTGLTLTAGVDYDVPAATNTAFVRITNAHHTGAGNDTGGSQNPDDVTAYITTADITSSFTIARDSDSLNNTRVSWELIEYVGTTGTDNEMIVHQIDTATLGIGVSQATGTAVSVADDSDVVVFLTGSRLVTNRPAEHDSGLVTTAWASSSNQAVLTRDNNDYEVGVSYAVVEFVGQNWSVQRIEHAFISAGEAEAVPITPVGDITKAFIEGQKRMSSFPDQASYGYQMWLSSMGAVSFYLDANASTPANHTAVAWVIENTQSGGGQMVVFPTNGTTTGGVEPLSLDITFDGSGVNDITNASIFGFATLDAINSSFPQVMASFALTSSTTFELWRSDTGSVLAYRTAVVQWPAADVAIRQNYYRWYDNGGLTPSNPWPPTGSDLGENTPITSDDTPVGEGDIVRLRTSYQISNGSLPANIQTLKLQYGFLGSNETCSAIGTWTDVGAPGSGVVWRGFDNGALTNDAVVGTNPPTGGQLLLSVSDRAGRYVEDGAAGVNPYTVNANEDMEYDWVLQHNGATQRSDYCFRTVLGDGSELQEYFFYPQLRTQGYAPVQRDWRWFDDEGSVTPNTPLAAENVAPVEFAKGNTVKLRVLVDETNNLEQTDARFKLQYSDTSDFSVVSDVVNEGACAGSDVWCYVDGAGVDNAVISSSTLSNTDMCTGGVGAGCGTHTESDLVLTGYTHDALSATEFEFTIQYQNVSGYYGQVWYFRLYDSVNDDTIPLDSGAAYPSVVGESGSITFAVDGLPSATTTEGVVTTVTTTADGVPFGSLVVGNDAIGAQRLTIDTNAVSGYQIELYGRQALTNDTGDTIVPVSGSNATPIDWSSGCSGQASCFGYHPGDDTLAGDGSRFSLDDTYAALNTSPAEIMYSAVPASESEDIIYRIVVGGTQAAGDYTSELVYLVTPVF